MTDVNQVGPFGERPLDVAAVRGNLKEIYALLDGGADVNAPGEHGYTALQKPYHKITSTLSESFCGPEPAPTYETNSGTPLWTLLPCETAKTWWIC